MAMPESKKMYLEKIRDETAYHSNIFMAHHRIWNSLHHQRLHCIFNFYNKRRRSPSNHESGRRSFNWDYLYNLGAPA